ncbi:hypothetical protein LEP1GSC073_1769 [Leptospira noguchii str. Cascata]|nr:hypothetical protein LEP1GSC073_1769 [Leptospira noguchii str. Cascata]
MDTNEELFKGIIPKIEMIIELFQNYRNCAIKFKSNHDLKKDASEHLQAYFDIKNNCAN